MAAIASFDLGDVGGGEGRCDGPGPLGWGHLAALPVALDQSLLEGETMFRKLSIAAAATIAATPTTPAVASALPSPQTTVYPKGPEVCWVSAYGPSISSNGPRISAAIGGRAACTGSAASMTPKHLQFQMWTQAHVGAPWIVAATYSVRGSRAVVTDLPPRLNVSSKVYAARTWAWGNFQEPNGFAGCSLHKPPACHQSVSGGVTGPAVVVKSNG